MPDQPLNHAQLLTSITNCEPKTTVIRSLYTQRDINELSSSGRAIFRAALAHLVDPESHIAVPGEDRHVLRAQTDYYYAQQINDFDMLADIIVKVHGRRS